MNAVLQEHPPLSATRGYIGGGNVAGILGVSPYKSPLDEYLTITGQSPANDDSREAFFKRRKALEPFAAEVFQQVTGLQIAKRNERYDDHEHAFMRAEIDFETDDGCNGETKTVSQFRAKDWGDPGTDEIPVYVTAQAMHGLMLKPQAPATWVHALIGLDDDRIFRVERDEALIAAIRAREVEFWHQHIEPRIEPAPVNDDDLMRMFLYDFGTSIEADADLVAKIHRAKELKGNIKALEEEFEALKLEAKLHMQGAATLVVNGLPLATWKTQSARRFDQTAFAAAHPELFEQFKTTSETRVFRLK